MTAVLTTLFAAIYRLLPSVRVPWRAAWRGGLLTALLYGVGQTAIGLYLGFSAIASSYGAAGAFVVLLVWIYYSAQIFLYGAALTCVLSRVSQGRWQPGPDGR